MSTTDPVLAELIALRQTVALLSTNVAVNTEVQGSLQRALDDMRANAVPRGEWAQSRSADSRRFDAVEDRVDDLEEVQKDDASFRRTMFAMFAVAAFSAALSFAVALTFFILGK